MRPLRATGLVALGMTAGFALTTVALKRVLPSYGDEESDARAGGELGREPSDHAFIVARLCAGWRP